jgi:lysylphosphatidylglycerol synthetase-like protein (DUF2156 family)
MTVVPTPPSQTRQRSTLVTVVGWLLLILSALATLGSLLALLGPLATPTETVNATTNGITQDSTFTQLAPAPYLFILQHGRFVAAVKVAWWVAVLAVSIGVLRRLEWARRAFLVVIAIELLLVTTGVFVGESIGVSLAAKIASTSRTTDAPPGMGSGLALGGLFGVAIIAALVWLLVTFRASRVRDEFASEGRAA